MGNATARIIELEEENRRLREGIKTAISDDDFRLTAPCILCGYSGPGFYQPEQHKCAALING